MEAGLEGRHLTWLLELIGAADLDGPDQGAWLDILQADLDNFHAGLERALDAHASPRDPELALALAGLLAPFWLVRGPVGLGRRWLDAALSAAGPGADPRLRAVALDGAGHLASAEDDQDAQLACQQQSLAIWRGLADDAGTASCLGDLGSVAYIRGEYAAAEARFAEALELAARAGSDMLMARPLNGLGLIAMHQNDLVRATEYHQKSRRAGRGAQAVRRGAHQPGHRGLRPARLSGRP